MQQMQLLVPQQNSTAPSGRVQKLVRAATHVGQYFRKVFAMQKAPPPRVLARGSEARGMYVWCLLQRMFLFKAIQITR